MTVSLEEAMARLSPERQDRIRARALELLAEEEGAQDDELEPSVCRGQPRVGLKPGTPSKPEHPGG